MLVSFLAFAEKEMLRAEAAAANNINNTTSLVEAFILRQFLNRKHYLYYLMKINRVVVWVLLFFMILLIVTGYGLSKPNLIHSLTGGIVNYQTAFYLHTLLDVPLLILLFVHVIIEIKFSLMRWGFRKQRLLNLLMFALGSVCLILILYVDGARP